MDCFTKIGLPRVKKSVCGCSLASGTIIIAWLQIIGGIIVIFASVLSLILENDDASKEKEPETGIIDTYIVFGICQLILGIILLFSAKWELDFLNVWVIISTLMIGIYVGVLLVQTFILMTAGLFNIGVTICSLGTLVIGLSFYCIILVSSFRKEANAAGRSL